MDHFERSGPVRGPGTAALAGRTVAVAVGVLLAVAAAVGLGVVALGGGPGAAVGAPNATASPTDATGASLADSDGTVVGGAEPVALTDDAGSSAADSPDSDASDDIDTTLIERTIHDRVNEIRRDRDRPTLAYGEGLAEIATYYSRRIATEEFFAHTGPDGQTLLDRYERFGHDCRVDTGGQRYVTGGENLAYTYADTPVETEGGVVSSDGNETRIARGIVEGWMNSPGHRENRLRPYWNREGVGVVLDPENGKTQVVATQNFC
ncbi:CAP domain-containing protein [Halosimplex halobium]|uniref:CAP domain-containing protein n=1 Tax=Halosimplex halobium TaxID=3396618 RepID=UPI003F5447EC